MTEPQVKPIRKRGISSIGADPELVAWIDAQVTQPRFWSRPRLIECVLNEFRNRETQHKELVVPMTQPNHIVPAITRIAPRPQ